MPDTKPFVFVLMPFSKDFTDIYRLGIKQAAEKLGLRAERVDEQIYSETMLERIYQQIDAADIIVADMTGQNPNVFYEVGYAHAKKKLCILTTQNTSDIPFDLKQHRHIVYGSSIVELQSQLEANLQWAAAHVAAEKTSGLSVDVVPRGGKLSLSQYIAKASVRFGIDLHNTADLSFGEIESINFYLGKGWTFSQAGFPAPKTASDVSRFEERHAFTLPMRRINPGGWAQLNFVGEKVVGQAFLGETLKDTYTLSGRVMVRVVTATRHYDFDRSLDVQVNDLPF
ncbi:hypothetical protein [Variovorax guangxiensis]|uniref:hypothetical protein n=1 Tax=Variovorax guangxiensis TaxID=1775474 RepID=UPI002861FE23|nr:hypothetical protein [Variovorax guangxiensis]MDR6861398.1 nucleoside 2-deoxyribosyltransferase [Variovorax guangxiensis]